MEELFDQLQAMAPLSSALRDQLAGLLQVRNYLKREVLHREGRHFAPLWFIRKGIAGYFYEQDDKDYCSGFQQENDFILSSDCERIVALEALQTYLLPHDRLQQVYACFPEFHQHIRLITQRHWQAADQRSRAFLLKQPAEKYRWLLQHHPQLILRVSATHLASYMGMAMETLSRVKGRM